jgi:catechol 2,3-dioxygenase-like lactoylglutathione lyase family enzyme
MTVTGPDFLALQVRDLDRSAHFYETLLGLRRMPASPPGAVVRHHPPSPSPSANRCPVSTWTRRRRGPGTGWRCGCTPITPRPCTTS